MTLTGEQVERAYNEGHRRVQYAADHPGAIDRGDADADFRRIDADRLQSNICGAGAELAVASHYGLPWAGEGGAPRNAPDAGEYGVRWSRRSRLILHDTDPGDRVFVLAMGWLPDIVLVGWALGAEGQRREFWRTDVPHPAYFLPIGRLQPMAGLPQAVVTL